MITSVTYRRLRSFGNYENEAVEATANVADYGTPEAALAAVRGWVEKELGVHEDTSEARERLWSVESQVSALDGRLKRMTERWEQAKAVLEKHGVPIDPRDAAVFDVDTDLPF